MTRHVRSGAIARFRAGDLRSRKSARIGAHLAQCARCAETSASLASVTTLLASTPAPPIPAHLSARISDALAAEAAQRIGAGRPAEPGRRDLPARKTAARRQPVLRVLAAAGAVVVVAGGGYALVSQLISPGTPTAASRPAGAGQGAPARAPAGLKYAAGGALGPQLHYRRKGRSDVFTPLATATNFTPAQLTAQVSDVIARAARHGGNIPNSSAGPAAGEPTGNPVSPSQFEGLRAGTLEACVTRISAGSKVILVDVARYRGGPATVIVTAPPASARQIWVVGPGCSASRSDILARQLLTGA
jgi:hypothetical protein